MEDRGPWGAAVHEVAKSQHNLATEQQQQQLEISWEITKMMENNLWVTFKGPRPVSRAGIVWTG